MGVFEVLMFLMGLAGLLSITIVVFVYMSSETYPTILKFDSENSFKDSALDKLVPFPSITDDPTKSLSVIVPAYNEEQRLPKMLDECLEYLQFRSKTQPFTYEVIIVDDGSKDGTSAVGLEYNKLYGSDKVRVLTLAKNRGKGGAVRLGVLCSRGELVLFADADGATCFPDYNKVEASIKNICCDQMQLHKSLAITCGSRAHLEELSVATRSYFRTVLMYGFHSLVWLLTVRGIKDTQCGFKLLTRRTAKIIFNSLHVERWAFDVEMLYIAQSLGIPIDEVSVKWTEIEGSKVTPIWSWIEMGVDIVIIWLRYALGFWKIKGVKL